MQSAWRYFVFAMHFAALAISATISSFAADGRQPQLAEEIKSVTWTMETVEPPNLTIHVSGINPWKGLTTGRLLRAHYDVPPKDGIQDFFLMVDPPDKTSSEGDSVLAAFTWQHCTRDAPWLKGIRVHGAKSAVVKGVATR
jgi:hypothetical protein